MISIKYVIPQAWSKDQKGNFFEKEVSRLLTKMRFEIVERIRFTGMEIDVLAKNRDTSQKAFVECKFLSEPFSSGVITDLLGKALIRCADIAYLFSTSEPGGEARGLIEELGSKRPGNGPIFAFVGPESIGQMYLDVLDILPIETRLDELNVSRKNIGSITLVVSPSQNFWAVEYLASGIPSKLFLVSLRDGEILDRNSTRELLDENGLWVGLSCEILEYCRGERGSIFNEKEPGDITDSVSSIPVADRFDDYRPCRPDDFVGRNQLQKEMWDFLKKVRSDSTKTRIVSLVGQSGFGKSSLILKLTDRFRNRRWRNQFYLYHVDTRSAVAPTFVAEAIRKGFNQAREDGFIKLDNTVTIDSIDSLLSSDSIKKALKHLKENRKVLIIFFDQFEELFTKEELFHVFENFRKLSFEVDGSRENFVIGCSWRTGISLPEDHPAYHTWHSLRDRRKEFNIDKFDSSEISQQLQLLGKYLGEPLENQLKRRLKEHCLGYPWLLKKLCIHIYRQVKRGISQAELITAQFNIEQLFDEDSVDLSESQMSCLKYIAMNSPVDVVELSKNYTQEVINQLYGRRLIVRTGYRYAIYWDIFRDYLVDGKLPVIPLTAIPTSNLGTILKAVGIFNKHDALSKDELARYLVCTQRTTQNILGDMLTFMMVRKVQDEDKYRLVDDIRDKSRSEIYPYLYLQFRHHEIIEDILNKEGEGIRLSMEKFRSYIAESYSSLGLSPQSLYVYSGKLLQWFSYCGLADTEKDYVIIYKSDKGKNKGQVNKRRGRGGRGQSPLFLCSSSLDKVAALVSLVLKNEKITGDWIKKNKMRTAEFDARALRILEWKDKILVPTEKYENLKDSKNPLSHIYNIVRKEALESSFIERLIKYQNTSKTVSQIGDEISPIFGAKWSEATKSRYIGAGLRWIRYLKHFTFP